MTKLFAPAFSLLSGLTVGILFGFLLRKAHVTRFNVIVGQLILKDFTVMKVILTAIAFGSFGIYLILFFFPEQELIINSTTLLAAFSGGGIFGIGMAILGFCPGTGVAALADGAKEMWFGLLGMIAGAALYSELALYITPTLKPLEKLTTQTLPQYLALTPWTVIACVFIAILVLFKFDKQHR
jgi:hypothetical protein